MTPDTRVSRSLLVVLFTLFLAVGSPGFSSALDGDADGASGSVIERERGLPDGVRAAWLSGVSREIAEAEYSVRAQAESDIPGVDRTWQATNRAQGFRAVFSERGARLTPRVVSAGDWEWSLRLIRAGRGEGLSPVRQAVTSLRDGVVELRRGSITEWFINDRRGLEQGFVFHERPTSTGQGAPGRVALELAVQGDLLPLAAPDDRTIDFADASGRPVLRYSGLTVTDATGRVLDARMRASLVAGSRRVLISFDDQDAEYPVTVDPVAMSAVWSVQSDVADARFGLSVATAGDVNGDGYSDVVVGAPLYGDAQSNGGKVFVYHGSVSGLSSTASWTAAPAVAGDQFGVAVSTAGDVNGDGYSDVIVGASLADATRGRAYLYLGSSSGLQATSWSPSGGQTGSEFAGAVAPLGDVNGDGFGDVAVGAAAFDNGHVDEGRVSVFLGRPTGLSASASWTAESGQAYSRFGTVVAAAGDVNGDGYFDLLVGAPGHDNGQVDEGRVYLYLGSEQGPGTLPVWTSESDQSGARFGSAVAAAGDVNGDGFADVLVGAHLQDHGQNGEGHAYVFHGSASGPSAAPDWTVEGDEVEAWLGRAVATAGDVNGDGYGDVIVGASLMDADQPDVGRAFVYLGSKIGLADTPEQVLTGDRGGAMFGESLAVAGDVDGDGFTDVIVGARFYADGEPNEGAAFVFRGSPSGLKRSVGWDRESDQLGARLGWSVASAGDVNGDGFHDLIVGAPFFDDGEANEGAAFVYLGSADGPLMNPVWSVQGGQENATLGAAVSGAGDVNGDGFADIVVGSDFYSNGETLEGAAFVYHGSPAGPSPTPSWIAEGGQELAQLGLAVAPAGDVNGDGYSDLVVGAWAHDSNKIDAGQARVYHGSPSGLAAEPGWTFDGDAAHDHLGRSVASAGDVNGDGYGDLIVGAMRADTSNLDAGRAYVFHGSPLGLTALPVWTSGGQQQSEYLGWMVSTAGDVNGDGYSDVAVGAPGYDTAFEDAGRVLVYHGTRDGLGAEPAWILDGDRADAELGHDVGAAGDVNSDGYGELVVSSRFYSDGEALEGAAFVYHGTTTGLAPTPAWSGQGDVQYARYGESVAPAGDVNGDGFADLLVGAANYPHPDPGEGRVFLYYGNGGPGLTLLPQQRVSDDSAPIAPLGISDDPDGFRLAIRGRTPYGRARTRVETEVKPLGVPFDGNGTRVGAWLDTGVSGAVFNEMIEELPEGAVYHSRVRLLYDSVQLPFQQQSRWLIVPINGREEGDLRTRDCSGVDSDLDGFGAPNDADCPPGPMVDCDDLDVSSRPGATEICDTRDNNCDGRVDEDATGVSAGGAVWVRSCRKQNLPVVDVDATPSRPNRGVDRKGKSRKSR